MKQQTEKHTDQKWEQIKGFLKDGKVHLALLCLRKYIHNNPSDTIAYLFAGDCLTEFFRYDEAIKMYHKSIKLWNGKHRFIPYTKIGVAKDPSKKLFKMIEDMKFVVSDNMSVMLFKGFYLVFIFNIMTIHLF